MKRQNASHSIVAMLKSAPVCTVMLVNTLQYTSKYTAILVKLSTFWHRDYAVTRVLSFHCSSRFRPQLRRQTSDDKNFGWFEKEIVRTLQKH